MTVAIYEAPFMLYSVTNSLKYWNVSCVEFESLQVNVKIFTQ